LSFGSIAPQISELRGVKNRPFPFTRHIAYTTACCYRTSRDMEHSFIVPCTSKNFFSSVIGSRNSGSTKRACASIDRLLLARRKFSRYC